MKNLILNFLLAFGLVHIADSVLAQPVINYAGNTSTNNYTFATGAAITAQLPANTGTPVGKYGAVTLIKQFANRSDPYGIATDPTTGNSYVIYYSTTAGQTSTTVYQVTPGGTQTALTFAGGNPLSQPGGIAEDSNGNLFISDTQNGQIYKFTISGTTATLTATIGTNTIGNIYAPQGIAIDASNNLYVADDQGGGATAGVIFEIAAGTTTVTSYQTGLNNPLGIAVDPSGNSYVSYGGATITKITPGGTKSTITGFTNAEFLSQDGNGNIYVADSGSRDIYRISSTGTVTAMITAGLTGPYQVSFDSSLNMYIADEPNASRSIFKSTPQYYSYTGTLPAGLVFNTTTGAFTGTPTTAGGPTAIVVTAYGTTSNATVTVNFTIKAVPTISYTGSPFTYYTGVAITNLNPTTTNSPTSFSISPTLPTGLNFSALGVISGTPTVASGTTTYTVGATNANGTGTTTISITVYGPPTISYTGSPFTYTVGTAITTLTPAVTNNPVSYSISPSINTNTGLTFSTTSGLISGTPTTASSPAVTYTITATNPAGNAMTTISVQVYPKVPTVAYTGSPYTYYTGVAITNLNAATTNSPTSFSVSPALPVGLGINPGTGQISGTPTAATATATYTVSAYNTNPTPGTTNIVITVDGPPTISYTGSPYSYTVGTAITTLTPSVTNNPTSYAISPSINTNTGLTFSTTTGQISGTPTIASSPAVTYTITATNPAGNGMTTISVQVYPKVPTVAYTGSPYTYYTGVTITNLNAATTNSPTSFSVSPALPAGLSINPGTGQISGTPTTATATGTYTVSAYNTNPTPGTTNIVITVNGPPTISYTGSPYTYTVGTPITTLTPSVTNNPTSYAISPSLNTNTGLTFSTTTGQISGTPTIASSPAVTYTITATNPAGNGMTTISVQVYPKVPTVAYTGSPYTYYTGVAITNLNAATTNSPTSFSVSPALPAGLSINPGTGQISGTPTTAAAATTYTISAYNANPTPGTTNIVITVYGPPTISYTGSPYTYTVGTAITTLTPTTGSDPISYSISPSLNTNTGLTFSTTTGKISGTPTTASSAVMYTVSATNPAGSGTTTITITIYPKSPTVAYTGSPYTFNTGTAISQLIPTVTGTPTSFTISPNITTNTGLNFNTTTGVVSGTPTTVSPAVTYTINAYNANPAAGTTTISVTILTAPTISYPTPAPYSVGTAISPQLTPASTGVGTTGTYVPTTILTGAAGNGSLNEPYGMAVDPSGNVYVTNYNNSTVTEYSTLGVISTFSLAANSGPSGIVFDSAGDAYVLDESSNKIVKYTVGLSGSPSNFATTGLNGATGIAIDALGNIYVANAGNNNILKYNSSGALVLTITPPVAFGFLTYAFVSAGIAVDAAGNIYVSDNDFEFLENTVDVYSASGVLTNEYGIGNTSSALYIDGSGNIYVTDTGNQNATIYSANFASTIATESGFNNPEGIVADYKGNFYVSDFGNNTVTKYSPSKGYVLTGTLPPGLSFSTTTGIVSGTPQTSFAAATYTVTCYNAGGGVSTTFTISCNNNPPVISYTPSTNVYQTGVAITPLAPAVSGGPIAPASFGTGTSFATGLSAPWGMTTDASGNIWVVDNSAATVVKYSNTGTVLKTYTVAATGMTGIAVNAAGTFFYLVNTSGRVYTYNAAGANTATSNTIFLAGGSAYGIALDASNNGYITDYANGVIWKYTNATGTPARLISKAQPTGIAVDAAGNIYVVDQNTKALSEYNSSGTFVTTLVSGLTAPYSLYRDANGDYYIGDSGTVTEYNISGTPISSATISGLGSPRGITMDAMGDLYVSDFTNNTITKYPPNYYVLSGGTLPAGLAFSATTGTFSGTPTAVFATTTFTITTYGSDGGTGTTTVTITCANGPAFTYVSPQTYTVGTAITALSPTVTTGGPLVSASSSPTLPAGLSISSTGVISGTPTVATATATYTITGGNSYGFNGTTTISITCVNPPIPVISYTTPDVYIINSSVVNLTPTNTGGSAVSYSAPTLPAGLSINTTTGVISGTPTTITPATNYPVTATNAGGTSVAFNVNITCNPLPPVLAYTTPDSFDVGTTITPLNPNNTVIAPTAYSVGSPLPAGLSIDPATGIISGTPTTVTANLNYVVTATNAGGTTNFTITIVVNGAAPVIAYTTPDVFTVGLVIPPLSPTNSGGAVTGGYTVSPGLPAGLAMDPVTGIITGTPTAATAAINYVVTAANLGGTGMFTINITVQAEGPVFTYTTPDVFPINTAITPLSPVNTGTTPVMYAISPGLPTGLVFNTGTGVISGTPTVTSPATIYTVTATDASSNTGTFNISIACGGGIDWIGVTSTDWNDPTNWASGTVPTATDIANIGVNQTFLNFPNLGPATPATNSVATVIIGSSSTQVTTGTSATAQAGGIVVNTGSILNVSGTITYLSDANAGTLTATLSGAGTINAAGVAVTANTTLATPAAYTETMTSSVTSLVLASNATLTSSVDGSGNALNATFNITGGITSIGGEIQTTNSTGTTSTISVTNATLQLAGATPLAGLSATGTNTISVLNTGATVEYSGAGQTVYTDLAITGLPGGLSYQNIKFSGTGVKTPNGTDINNLNIVGDFTNDLTINDADDYINLTTPMVNFTGTTENIYGGNGTGTSFDIVNFSGTGTTTIQSGNVYLASLGVLTMSNTAQLAAGGFLTLVSDVNGAATVAAIPLGCSITGTVNAERYLTGDAYQYRGYRLLSSPVSTSATSHLYELNYLQNSCYLTGTTGTAGGFDGGSNPTLYLFREDLVPSNATFTSGNYRGINNIVSNLPAYEMDVDNGPYTIPQGNGYLFFFRGDRSVASFATETTTTYVPTSTTLTASGALNQGAIPVNSWYTPNGTGLIYTTISGSTAVEGFNLVGNPYPSSINWDLYSTTSSAAGIYAPNVEPFLYILNSKSGNYNVYQAGNGGVGTVAASGSNVIPSGQGFFVVATANNTTLTFNEAAKTNLQATAAQGNLFLGAPPVAAISQYMRIMLVQDSLDFDGTIINFNSSASQNYVKGEDAIYRKGNGAVGLSSVSADNIQLAINGEPLPNLVQSTIPLNLLVSADGPYSLNLSTVKSIPALYEIWLKDAMNKDSLDIKDNPNYAFSATASDSSTYAHRFSLVIRQNPALMIHLLSFSATKITGGDQVVWTTENEQNYTYFTVERSTDGGANYSVLGGYVSSAIGSYSYLDNAPVPGANTYRLKIVDLNGTISYSNAVTIMYANTNNQIAINGMMVYPNPTAGALNVSIANQTTTGTVTTTTTTAATYNIEIVNNMGAVIKTAQSGSPLWQTDVSSLIPGTYFIRVINASNNSVVGRTAFVKL